MNRNDLAVIVCRVMAMYVLFHAVTRIELVSAGVLQFWQDYGDERTRMETAAVFMASLTPFLGLLFLGCLLWSKAGWWARRMTRDLPPVSDAVPGLDAHSGQAVAFAAAGVLILSEGLVALGQVLVYARQLAAHHPAAAMEARLMLPRLGVVTATQIILGGGLLLGSQTLAGLMPAVRRARTVADKA